MARARQPASTRRRAMLAQVWDDDLQRVIWDARVRREHPADPLALRGFLATSQGIQVNLVADDGFTGFDGDYDLAIRLEAGQTPFSCWERRR